MKSVAEHPLGRIRAGEKRLDWLAAFMGVAEFLARETRCTD